MAAMLQSHDIDILFAIGGDGTMRGAMAISEELSARGRALAVIGIPKTIDNDIPYVRRSFGFETAVAHACEVIGAANNEARGVLNGIGLVKLMGRHSGYIAANTTLAAAHVNYCLVPEVPFAIEGRNGLLSCLEERFTRSDHAVIVVAEGAGQQYFTGGPVERDSSGNVRLGDIGVYLRDRIAAHFKAQGRNVPVRYIDPSYTIRAAAANPGDVLFCALMAQNAVHAAMAGKTAMLVGNWHGHMTHVPMRALIDKRQSIDPKGDLWFTVMEATGQPERIGT
jgi:6-phosphofructokinase 1